MDIKAVALVGIKIDKEDLYDVFDIHLGRDKDHGKEWYSHIKPYLTEMQDCYIFSKFSQKTPEETVSILSLHNSLNYTMNEDMILDFKTYFPELKIEKHQLDIYLGLQVV